MELHVLNENTMREYTDDEDLIIKTDLFLRYYTAIKNMAELVLYPMEYFVKFPNITIEVCQLIYDIRTRERNKIDEWRQKQKDFNSENYINLVNLFYEHLADEYKKELENEANQPEYC